MFNKSQWAEDHGYYQFKCPECGRHDWTDTTPECSCGWSSEELEPEPEYCRECGILLEGEGSDDICIDCWESNQ